MKNTIVIIPNPNPDFNIKALDINNEKLVLKARHPEKYKQDAKFFEALGYIATRAKRLTAYMQDTLYPKFAEAYSIEEDSLLLADSKKIGPAGYHSAWCLSLGAVFSRKDLPKMPKLVKKAIRNKKAKLNSNDLIITLVNDYGFEFKAHQNLEAIRAKIPQKYLKAFERGVKIGLTK